MAEFSQDEIETAQENYASILSQLSNSYRDITEQQKKIRKDEEELISVNAQINAALRAKKAGLKLYINSQGEEVSVARSLNGLLVKRADYEQEYMTALQSLTEVIYDRMRDEANKMNEEYNKEQIKAAAEFNRIGRFTNTLQEKMKLFNKNIPAVKMLMLGEILMKVGKALTDLRNKVYKLQSELGTTFMSAITAGAGAIYNQVRSFFSSGPILSFQDTVDTVNAFQKEFGGLLTTDAARRIAQSAKDLGVSAEVFLKAQRSFLVAGGEVTKTTFITQFRNAGLTAAQALNFAANNANLVAIAGVKYADSLARAAANAQRIGVSLEKTEQFADNLVGDFEGGLERFSELRAMGVEVDFNRLAQVAAAGTPEEVFGELSRELGGNKALLENIQKNRFLKVAIEKDLGLSIADVTRMAGGEAAKSTEETAQEKTRTALTTLTERLGTIGTVIGGLVSAMGTVMGGILTSALGTNTTATIANTSAMNLTGRGGISTPTTGTPTSVTGTSKFAGGAKIGTAVGVTTGLISGIATLMEGGGWKKAILMTIVPIIGGLLGGVLGTALVTALAATGIGAPIAAAIGPSLIVLMSGAGATLAGAAVSAFMGEGKAQGGLITGTGTATSDNIMTPTSPGEFVVNAKATQAYGTDFLNKVNSATYQPSVPAVNNMVNVDMSTLESKLDKLANSFGKLKIQMSGYDVGNISLNDRSPLFTASPSRVVG